MPLSFYAEAASAREAMRALGSTLVFRGAARRGKTSVGWFSGFKLHLVVHERDELNPVQARMQAELRAIKERLAMETAARKRGEREPSLHADPEAYVKWLQRQRDLPWVEMARSLDQQSR